MKTGDIIYKKRKELNLSVEDLATLIGKDRATIYRYENKQIENMPISILMPLAKALKTTPLILMGWEDENMININNSNFCNSNICNGTESYIILNNEKLYEMENELLKICKELNTKEKHDLLNYAYSLLNKKKE